MQAVANGESLFSPEIAKRLMHFFTNLTPAAPTEVFPELTAREREILTLIAQGDTNADIAAKLTLSVKTVRNHVSNIFSCRRPTACRPSCGRVKRASETNKSCKCWIDFVSMEAPDPLLSGASKHYPRLLPRGCVKRSSPIDWFFDSTGDWRATIMNQRLTAG